MLYAEADSARTQRHALALAIPLLDAGCRVEGLVHGYVQQVQWRFFSVQTEARTGHLRRLATRTLLLHRRKLQRPAPVLALRDIVAGYHFADGTVIRFQ